MLEREDFKNYQIINSANDKMTINYIKNSNFDFILTIGYGEILKSEIVSLSKNKLINIHPGILPENSGSDPFVISLLKNIKPGFTIHYIDEKIDSGKIIFRKEISASKCETYNSLQLKLSAICSEILTNILIDLKLGKIKPKDQDFSNRKYFNKLKENNRLINFNMKCIEIQNQINAFSGQYENLL